MRKRRPLFNLPNALTLSRFVFAPIILWLVLRMQDPTQNMQTWQTTLWILIILLVALFTDLIDGAVARARKEVTNFGKIMDPVADSTFFMTVFFGLSESNRFGQSVTVWIPILVLYREIAMHILRRYAALKGHAVPAKFSGKAKMFTQSLVTAVFFFCVLIRDWTFAHNTNGAFFSEQFIQNFAFGAGVFTVIVNLLSLVEYSRDVPELIAEYVQAEPGDKDAVEDGEAAK